MRQAVGAHPRSGALPGLSYLQGDPRRSPGQQERQLSTDRRDGDADAASDRPQGTIPEITRSTGELLVSRVALVAVGVYIGAQVIAQVTSLKIGTVFGHAVDMGTFIYPVTFTLRDVIHKAAGRRAARVAISTSAVVNLFLAAYLAWVVRFRTDPSYPLGREYAEVLGPIWRLVIASLLAMVVSELVDTEVYHWWVTRITVRYQWLRVLVSNSVSVPLDSLIFSVGAFASLPLLHTGSLRWSAVWDILLVNVVVKGLVSIGSLPFIYVTADRHLAEA